MPASCARVRVHRVDHIKDNNPRLSEAPPPGNNKMKTLVLSLLICCSLLFRVEASDARPLVQLLKILPLINASITEDQVPAEQIPINLPPLTDTLQNIPEINYIDFLKLTTAKRTSDTSAGEFSLRKFHSHTAPQNYRISPNVRCPSYTRQLLGILR